MYSVGEVLSQGQCRTGQGQLRVNVNSTSGVPSPPMKGRPQRRMWTAQNGDNIWRNVTYVNGIPTDGDQIPAT